MQIVQQKLKIFWYFHLHKQWNLVESFLWDTKTFKNYEKQNHPKKSAFHAVCDTNKLYKKRDIWDWTASHESAKKRALSKTHWNVSCQNESDPLGLFLPRKFEEFWSFKCRVCRDNSKYLTPPQTWCWGD